MSYITSRSLLRRAHAELDSAHTSTSPQERFVLAHMAALRGAAAALATSGGTIGSKRRKVQSAWVQLAELSPEWLPWVEYYSASAITRAEIESGQQRELQSSQAREAVRAASQFLKAVEAFVQQREARFRAMARAS